MTPDHHVYMYTTVESINHLHTGSRCHVKMLILLNELRVMEKNIVRNRSLNYVDGVKRRRKSSVGGLPQRVAYRFQTRRNTMLVLIDKCERFEKMREGDKPFKIGGIFNYIFFFRNQVK